MALHWWGLFFLVVVILLALDLGIFQRKTHEMKLGEALGAVALRVALALGFNAGIYFGWIGEYGSEALRQQAGLEFLTGYLVEIALSVDNVFVFALVFKYFAVPGMYQHRILFWGILGALIMRAIMIFAGIELFESLHWINYVFALILIYGGIKMMRDDKDELDPMKNPILRLVKRCIPVTTHLDGQKFFTRFDGRLHATPLFVVLIAIETTDLIFAIDSIPAVLAVTRDSFIVFTSNIFAILGLRALYFALSGVMGLFRYLHYGLSAILVFIGVKLMLAHTPVKIATEQSLAVVGSLLAVSIIASLAFPKKEGND